jgi:hypothetical protein
VAKSRTVSGSTRVPSPVLNQPLKSIVHTSFGLCPTVKCGRQIATAFRAFARRLTVRFHFLSHRVIAASEGTPAPNLNLSTRPIFGAPHFLCFAFNHRIRSSHCSLGRLCTRHASRPRLLKPRRPFSSKRALHLYAVFRLILHSSQSSTNGFCLRSHFCKNFHLCSFSQSVFQGIPPWMCHLCGDEKVLPMR